VSRAGLDAFDKTLQTTHIWLNELMQEIGPDRQVAWHVLGAVLRTIRDRIPVGLAAHLGSQLPILVRGTYYDQWHAPGQSLDNPPRSLDEFLVLINEQLANIRPVNVRDATRAVFGILSRHVNRGQVEKVREAMPEQVRAIWEDSPEAPDVRQRPRRYRGDADRDDAEANERSRRPQPKRVSRKSAKRRPAPRTRKISKSAARTRNVRSGAAAVKKVKRSRKAGLVKRSTQRQRKTGRSLLGRLVDSVRRK
jgi:uncharacterized protein (DUF2267 family)